MLGSKKENRYNAYMKKTDSGIIVKTVDSVTGVESLIKFTSDSIALPGEKFEDDPSKENIRPVVKKFNEAIPFVNKRKKYSLSKRNLTFITKLNNIRPHLKELQPNIPDFHIYEDSSSSALDFQNPNVIFVANSKLARDGFVNLTIPGKLGNVCYHGVLNENGIVKFKAKSVIKPFTIVIGDYVINVNICHDLTSVKDMKIPNQLKNKDGSILSNNSKGNIKLPNKDIFTDIKETDIESKTNENKFTQGCKTQMDNETAVIPDSVHGRLEGSLSNDTVKSDPHVDENDKSEVPEFLIHDLESTEKLHTQTEPIVAGESLDKSSSEENNETEEIETKLPLVNLSVDKFTSLSDQSSENIITETKCVPPLIYNSHISQNLKSCESYKTSENTSSIRDCLSSVSNSYIFPDDSEISKMKQSRFSTNSFVNGYDTNNSSDHYNLETKTPIEFDNTLTQTSEESKDKRPSSRCSNISLLEIKRKLSEATTSLHKLCSVIESIDNFSGRSSEETVGINQTEIVRDKMNEIIQGSSSKTHSNPPTNYPHNESDMNKSYTEGTYQLKNKCNTYQADECENIIQTIDEEIAISKDIMEKAGNKFSFHGKRHVQSLIDLSELDIPYVDNVYKRGQTSNHLFLNYQTKTSPNVLVRTKYLNNLQAGGSQRGKIYRELSGKIKESSTTIGDAIPFPNESHSDDVSSLLSDRTYTTRTRYNQELDSGTNLRQENQTSDQRINIYSTNSIKTIYMKSDCTSSNNLAMPVQHLSIKMFKDTNEVQTNNTSVTKLKPSCEDKVSKSSFSQKIKQKLSKLRTHIWNFGTVNNRKESDLTQLMENSKCNLLGTVSAETKEHLIYFAGRPKSLIYLNNDDDKENKHNELRDSKIFPGCKFTPCNNCSQILSDIMIKAPTTNSNKKRGNVGLLKNTDALDANCIMDPSDTILPFSNVSFSK